MPHGQSDMMCYAFHEKEDSWYPWCLNSERVSCNSIFNSPGFTSQPNTSQPNTSQPNTNFQPSVQYRIVNLNYGCLVSNRDGRIGQYVCSSFEDQYFTLENLKYSVDTYMIRGVHSDECIVSNSYGRFNGLSAYQCISAFDQQFKFEQVPSTSDTYMIQGVESKKCLAYIGGYNSGTQECMSTSTNQLWKITQV